MEALLQKIREPIRSFIGKIAVVLNKLSGGRVTAEMVTLFGFAMHVPIAILIATQYNVWAAVLLVIFGLFDTLDGAMARVQNTLGPRGMLLDSTTDRMKEILLYIGAAYAIIAGTGRPYLAVWAVAACGCSLLTSYINAWGDAVMARYHVDKHTTNKSFRGGLFPFEVRMFVLVVGLLSDRVALAVIVIAIGAAYTALSRLLRVFGKLHASNV
jgi:phosphatidylglycerophosphate synthase